jgi:hypothetical protein
MKLKINAACKIVQMSTNYSTIAMVVSEAVGASARSGSDRGELSSAPN